VETTSQGVEQWRHWGINYDLVLFTNLHPEHLEAHGSFANYKAAKLKLFDRLTHLPTKKLADKIVPKTVVVNLDDQYASEFLGFPVNNKLGYTLKTKYDITGVDEVRIDNLNLNSTGSPFKIRGVDFTLPLLGEYNVYNAAAAITCGLALGLDLQQMSQALKEFYGVPGRLEEVNEGQPFKVIVDYAFEPEAMKNLYQVVKNLSANKIIHILGGTGGGRDVWRRPVLGEFVGQNADTVIITNEDPYDEDPQQIIDQVAAGALKAGKILDQNLFKILDRRTAIAKAISLAQAGDLVLITGKGSEQAIAGPGGKLTPWDDRQVVREELKKLKSS
jgi:UDP-N-acetylmuramoyl-L-alanyl-D-glutamate--2,6-diaminopimelate ligase